MDDESAQSETTDKETDKSDDAPEDTSETEEKEAPAEEEASAPAEPDPLAPIWKSSKLTTEQIERLWLAYGDDPEADWIYSIAGIIVDPMADVSATADPERPANNIDDKILTCAKPGQWPGKHYGQHYRN